MLVELYLCWTQVVNKNYYYYTFAYKIWNRSLWRLCEWAFTKTASNTKQTSKLLLNFDRRMSTNELHQQLSLLKVVDIHTINVTVLSFVNECRSGRCPILSSSYYHVREAGYELRRSDRLHVPMARTEIGRSSCKIKGAGLWNNKFNLVNHHLNKKALERLSRNTLLKLITKFVTSYNILYAYFAIVMISYLSAPCCIIRLLLLVNIRPTDIKPLILRM